MQVSVGGRGGGGGGYLSGEVANVTELDMLCNGVTLSVGCLEGVVW